MLVTDHALLITLVIILMVSTMITKQECIVCTAMSTQLTLYLIFILKAMLVMDRALVITPVVILLVRTMLMITCMY